MTVRALSGRREGRRSWVATVLAVVILAACAGRGPTSAAPSSTPIASAEAAASAPSDSAPPTRFNGQVAVGAGGSLAVECLGSGSPTILLEAGGTQASLRDWGTDFPIALARLTTVCLYSHRGGDGSSPASDLTTWAAILADADAVLAAMRSEAGITGPYVFIGWSFGGEVALGEAVEDLSRTAGLVILDTDFPVDFMPTCLAAGGSQSDCQAQFDGDLEAKQIEADLVKTFRPLPGIPISLVSALGTPPDCAIAPGASAVTRSIEGKVLSAPDCPTLMSRVAAYDLTQWRSLGPQVTQTLVDADHDRIIRLAGPQIVDVIAGVLAQAR